MAIGYVGPQSAINGALLAADMKISGNPVRIVTVPTDQGLSLNEKTLDFLLEQGVDPDERLISPGSTRRAGIPDRLCACWER